MVTKLIQYPKISDDLVLIGVLSIFVNASLELEIFSDIVSNLDN